MLAVLRAFAIAAILAIMLTSCGDDDSESEEEAGAEDHPTDSLRDGRRQGGELTIARLSLTSLDPFIGFEPDVNHMLWRSLYSLGTENELVAETNGIAAGLPEVSADGKVLTVRLNAGLSWSDGDDLRAEDFVAGVIRNCHPLTSSGSGYLSNLVGCDDLFFADPASADLSALQAALGVRAVDALTIEFTLRVPQPSFAASALGTLLPVPVHLPRFAAATPDEPGEWGDGPEDLVFNGPYVLLSHNAESASFGPNPQWSGLTKPSLDRLHLRFIDEVAATIEAYRAGEVQVVQLRGLAGPEEIRAAREEFGEEYGQSLAPATRALHMQLEHEALENLDVRLALARAIDREALNQSVYLGTNVPTTSWIPTVVSGPPIGTYDDSIGSDSEAARAHLEAAGYPNGEGFPVLTFLIIDDPEFVAVADFLRQQFSDVLNIETEVEALPDFQSVIARLESGQFDLFLFGWAGAYGDPEEWILGLFNTLGVQNYDNCSDPEIDALIEEAELNPDDQRRRELYLEAERLVIERVCGVAPFAHLAYRWLVKPELTGFVENTSGLDFLYPGDYLPEVWGLRAD
jgi:oligopeptide transport system substrate-binding protein